jgi:hypothetical protein
LDALDFFMFTQWSRRGAGVAAIWCVAMKYHAQIGIDNYII